MVGYKSKTLVLEERLSHASGALADITILVTSCVPKEKHGNEKLHQTAEAVLSRILCSADSVKRRPSHYIHDWEEKLYEEYFSGKLKACASEEPCVDIANSVIDGKLST